MQVQEVLQLTWFQTASLEKGLSEIKEFYLNARSSHVKLDWLVEPKIWLTLQTHLYFSCNDHGPHLDLRLMENPSDSKMPMSYI